MHFRIRKNVIQLIRTTYDKATKKGKNTIVGTVKLDKPELTDDVRGDLSPAEIAEFECWVGTQRQVSALRQELAALTLADTLEQAAAWFQRQDDTDTMRTLAIDIHHKWQLLRRVFAKNNLLD
jgi:hypothetical protein